MMKHPRLLFAALVLVASVSAAWAQTEERSIYVSALDKSDKPVTGLTPADFVIRENGIAREVLRVEPATDPAHIALLVDTSAAIDPYVLDIRRGLQTFFKEVAGKHDVAVISYGERPTVVVDYTRDLKRLESAMGSIYARRGSGTELLEALVDSARGLQRREAKRPVIILFNVRGQEFGELTHKSVTDELRKYPITVYALLLNKTGTPAPGDRIGQELELTLAEATKLTGGHRDELLTTMALGDRFHAVLDELNNQYKVTYGRPKALIPPDSLQVTSRRSDVTVRAREIP